MNLRFDETKATQVAALILRLRGGRMHYIKLLKLLYLVDREGLRRWGIPVTTDRFASMDHGPIVSNIFNLITDEEKPRAVWGRFISAPMGDWEVELVANQDPGTSRLSKAEESLINEVYAQFGYRNRWDLIRNHMHKLPEWRHPDGSSIPIHIRQILEAIGEDEDEIRATLRELRTIASAEEVLSPVL